jgi:hypothetical protein
MFWDHVLGIGMSDYPVGVAPVPICIRGTAFFAGGSGLYVTDPYGPLPPFPLGGIMFVGNNLDAHDSFVERAERGEPHGSPARPMRTWQNLYRLLDEAGVERSECFFTNAFVGLVTGANPSAGVRTKRDSPYWTWCREFLTLQLRTMRPRLVVSLGASAQRFLDLSDGIGVLTVDDWSMRTAALAHPSLYPANCRARRWAGRTGRDAESALLREASST